MLLSAERPLVGAFAVRMPGATLRHRDGLVPAVLPAPLFGGRDVMGQEPSSFWVFRRNSRALTIVGAPLSILRRHISA
jgi:hypothetical protein